jgi:hypothetical protein
VAFGFRAPFPPGSVRTAPSLVQYDVSPDGKRFIMIRPVAGEVQGELTLVQNFFEELRSRTGR